MLCVLARRLRQLSKRKRKADRHEVRVLCDLDIPTGRIWYQVTDRGGILAQGYCASRRDVAREATRISALALNVPEGRIKINRVVDA